MQVPNQSQVETTGKPVRPVSEPQPVLSEVASRAKLRDEEPAPREAGLALARTDQGKAGSSASEAPDFAAEIESLRIALQRLQLAFSCTTTIEEHLKLASAISLITASISRLVRTQNYLASNRLPEINREIKAALDVVVKEYGRT